MTDIIRPRPAVASQIEPLWREVLGQRLRGLRLHRGETLTETAQRAGVSPQYLSEIERGLKDPSSEVLAAVTGALGVTLLDLTERVTLDLRAPAPLRTVDRSRQTMLMAA